MANQFESGETLPPSTRHSSEQKPPTGHPGDHYQGECERHRVQESAGEEARRELREAIQSGWPPKPVAKDSSSDSSKLTSGKITTGKIIYDGSGQIKSIDFDNADKSQRSMQQKSPNSESPQLSRMAKVQQAEQFLADSFADPKNVDSNGKPLSERAQVAASQLTDALLEGDATALKDAAQRIMKNPEMEKSIKSELERAFPFMRLTFGTDAQGRDYMKAPDDENIAAVVVPKDGLAYAAGIKNGELEVRAQNFGKTLKGASTEMLNEVQIDMREATNR